MVPYYRNWAIAPIWAKSCVLAQEPSAFKDKSRKHTVAERNQLMEISPLAGKPAPKNMLVDLSRLEREYYERRPDIGDPDQLVSFGTSGHRGSSLRATFTESHILAITQAICDCRRSHGTDAPLQMGKDTHALSSPAQRT